MLKDKLAQDLKHAMLSGDKPRVELLGMLKSSIQYKEVELGVREAGLSEEQIIEVFSKEAKKRQEAATMYEEAGDPERATKELREKEVIQAYLPEQMSKEEIEALVQQAIDEIKPEGMKDMGRVIGVVKVKAGATADGGLIAQIVKQNLG